jgi:leukotriene-A4 hydrolase
LRIFFFSKNLEIFYPKIRALNIEKVFVQGEECKFVIGDRGKKCEALGLPLIITSTLDGIKDQLVEIKIKYNTTGECSALQWLTKAQTCGGKHPYLFSQCQVNTIYF